MYNYCVFYLAYKPLKKKIFRDFIKSYRMFKSGNKHLLIICFKNFHSKKIITHWKEILVGIKYVSIEENYKKNDYDINSYYRVAKRYKNKIILFLNSYSRINVNNWLRLITKHYCKKTVVGCTASHASLSTSYFRGYFKKISFFKNLKYGFANFFRFPIFPNPHLRTNAFLIKGSDFLTLKFKLFRTKLDSNIFESGRVGMTRQLIKKGFKIILAGKNGIGYENDSNWKNSEVYSFKDQKNLIISDNHTKNYATLSPRKKKLEVKHNWGF